MLLYALDEDTTLTTAHSDGIVTNRSASGPITLTLPDVPPPGTVLEIHCVEPYILTVAGQVSDNIAGLGTSVVIPRGKALRIVYTAPHFWSGVLS